MDGSDCVCTYLDRMVSFHPISYWLDGPGDPNEGKIYQDGVRMGATGLMLNSIILGFTSVALERFCRKFGAGLTCGVANIIMFFFLLECLFYLLLQKIWITHQMTSSKWSCHLCTCYFYNPGSTIGSKLTLYLILQLVGTFWYLAWLLPMQATYTIPVISSRMESLGLGEGGWLIVSVFLVVCCDRSSANISHNHRVGYRDFWIWQLWYHR